MKSRDRSKNAEAKSPVGSQTQRLKIKSVQRAEVKRVGLFGGSFDPVHLAHVSLAKKALDQFQLDRIVWIPAAISPFKQAGPTASAADRLSMLQIVCRDQPRFEINNFEIEQGGVSYTIDSLRYFQKQNPSAQIYWILGADAWKDINAWKESSTLLKEMTFIVAARSGHLEPVNQGGKRLDMDYSPIASSEIRAGLSRGRYWDHLDPRVADYIRKNKLYGVSA